MKKTNSFIFSKSNKGHLSLDFLDFDYWESVDDILGLLDDFFEVTLVKELDGPATRYRKIEIENSLLDLYYTSYGTFINAEDEKGNKVLKMIKDKFEKGGSGKD